MPGMIITKGRHKIDSAKRDTAYWEHVEIVAKSFKISSGWIGFVDER